MSARRSTRLSRRFSSRWAPATRESDGVADAHDARGLARRPLVPRSRRQQRTLLGTRAGDQAADAARGHGTALHVDAGVSNVQYRLKEVDGGTLITFRHSALGFVPDDYQQGLDRRAGRRCTNAFANRQKRAGRRAEGGNMSTDSNACCRNSSRKRRRRGACSSACRAIACLEAARQVDVARPAGAARRDRAGRYRRDLAACRRSRCRSSSSPAATSAAELIPALDQSLAKARAILRHGRRRAGENLAGDGRRPGSDGASGRRGAALDHAEPLVSPPRTAVGLSAGKWACRCRRSTVRVRTRIRSPQRGRRRWPAPNSPTAGVPGAACADGKAKI